MKKTIKLSNLAVTVSVERTNLNTGVSQPQHTNTYFYELDVLQSDAVALSESIAPQVRLENPLKDLTRYINWPAWAALKLSGYEPERILEFGTYEGVSTLFLSLLFPKAEIYTIELPINDPLYSRFHPETEKYETLLHSQFLNKNIKVIRANSTTLLEQDLPMFDFIWVDGEHQYPAVAFDHIFALSRLKVGGWMFCDDIFFPVGNSTIPPNEVYKTIEYINKRLTNKFRFMVQLIDKEKIKQCEIKGNIKYIAYLHKEKG